MVDMTLAIPYHLIIILYHFVSYPRWCWPKERWAQVGKEFCMWSYEEETRCI
jgi:hypothetical protein